ncbi:MAG: PilN domain-containing protein [Candidatus Methylomirabilia bacterium]
MIKVNLLPSAPKRRLRISLPSLPGLGPMFGVLYVAVVVGMGWYWWTLSQEASQLQQEIAQAQQELNSLKAVIAEGNRFKQEKEDLERRLALIEEISRNQARPVYLLDALADGLSRGLWLTGVEEKEDLLTLAGTAFSHFAVADFMANLRKSGKFMDVDLVVSRQDLEKAPHLVTFEVVARFGI